MTERNSLAICIGRFQPVHIGHLDLFRQTLELADKSLIILGSAFQSPTTSNPFTWEERAEMIRRALPAEWLDRMHFLSLCDYFDTQRWAQRLAEAVKQFVMDFECQSDSIVQLGSFSDPAVSLHPFLATWKQQPRERMGEISSTVVRDWLFSSHSKTTAALHAQLEAKYQPAFWIHPSTLTYLRAWQQQPVFRELADQWLRQGHRDQGG